MTPYFQVMLRRFEVAVIRAGAETWRNPPLHTVIPPKDLVDRVIDQMELQMMGIRNG